MLILRLQVLYPDADSVLLQRLSNFPDSVLLWLFCHFAAYVLL
jgi:hypothetical protein